MKFFPPDVQKRLIEAVDSDQPGSIEQIFQDGFSVESGLGEERSIPGSTVLTYASSIGAIKVVRCLLSLKANPNAGRADSKPLVVAACNNQLECVRALLSAGADPNPATQAFPLMMAI